MRHHLWWIWYEIFQGCFLTIEYIYMYLHSYNRKRSQQNIMTSLLPRSLPRKLQWSPSLASLSRTSWGMMFSTTPSHAKQPVLAIRREDSSVWERRAPLNPHHVQNVIQSGIKVSDLELVSSSLQSQSNPRFCIAAIENIFTCSCGDFR